MSERPKIHSAGPEQTLSDEALADALRALESGATVAVPTETVYGRVVRADIDPATGDGAAAAPAESPLGGASAACLLLCEKDGQAIAGGAELPRLAQRLADRYWPGPLALTLRTGAEAGSIGHLAQDGWLNVRVPAHPLSVQLAAAAPFPLALQEQGVDEGAPPCTAEDAATRWAASDVALVLDGGKSPIGEPATVLGLGTGRFETLRTGIIDAADLRAAAGLRMLFVCTGNTCRSPMAEALTRSALEGALGSANIGAFGFEVGSRGVYAGPGAPASAHSVAAMNERGLDLTAHGSTPVNANEIADADRVYCLTSGHRDALLDALPPRMGQHVELLDPDGGDVPDPYGRSIEIYRATADAIEQMVEARLGEWV